MINSEKKAASVPRKSQIPPYPRNSKFNALRPSQTNLLVQSPLLESGDGSDQWSDKFNGVLCVILK